MHLHCIVKRFGVYKYDMTIHFLQKKKNLESSVARDVCASTALYCRFFANHRGKWHGLAWSYC